MNNRTLLRVGIVVLVVAVAIAAYVFKINQYFTLDFIREQQAQLKTFQETQPFFAAALYFLVYVCVAAFSIPGAAVLTLLGGALFGLWQGIFLVSFASTTGATLAFILARFLLRDWIQKKYSKQLDVLNDGFKKEGVFYLFALRLIPAFPFFLVNILSSIMPIKTSQFYGISQLGMLPGTAVYVYAGTELAKIKSLSDLASPSLIAAFVMLGLLPLAVKKITAYFKKRTQA